jgi:hypothetical protein
MEIIGRNPTPDKYSIKSIKISYDAGEYEKDGTRRLLACPYLLVELEPQFYRRDRGFGPSYETKNNPCTLRIALSEVQEMQQALTGKLEQAIQLLFDNDQLNAFLFPEKSSNTKQAS